MTGTADRQPTPEPDSSGAAPAPAADTDSSAAASGIPARRVIVGVDSSQNARHAAAWAARRAGELDLPLYLVHALGLPGGPGPLIEPLDYAATLRHGARKLLNETAATLRRQFPGVEIVNELSDLDPAATLVELSKSASLVVTGTRGHGGFAGMLLGSVSAKLAAHAHCPAVVVRGAEFPLARGIVLGIEPGQAEAPIRFAFATAAEYDEPVIAVRAWEEAPVYGGYYVFDPQLTASAELADAETLLKAVQEDYPQVETATRVTRGHPVPVLIDVARGARLLVVGAHRRRGPLSVGAGHLANSLLAHSPVPVAVVPVP